LYCVLLYIPEILLNGNYPLGDAMNIKTIALFLSVLLIQPAVSQNSIAPLNKIIEVEPINSNMMLGTGMLWRFRAYRTEKGWKIMDGFKIF
jgi:hypothetical protein